MQLDQQDFSNAFSREISSCLDDEGASGTWSALAGNLAIAIDLPMAAGGFELGQSAVNIVCRELGRKPVVSPYLDTYLAADLFVASAEETRLPILREIANGETTIATLNYGDPGMVAPGTLLSMTRAGAKISARIPCAMSGGQPDFLLAIVPWPDNQLSGYLISRDEGAWCCNRDSADGQTGILQIDQLLLKNSLLIWRANRNSAACSTIRSRAALRWAAFFGGLASGVHDRAVAYSNRRRLFQGRLIDLQTASHTLASRLVDIEAAQALTAYGAWLVDRRQPALTTTLQALALSMETALTVTRQSIQLHGASGLCIESPDESEYYLAMRLATSQPSCQALWIECGRQMADDCGV